MVKRDIKFPYACLTSKSKGVVKCIKYDLIGSAKITLTFDLQGTAVWGEQNTQVVSIIY
mgnify:CR=1 FL=1